jgi:hypothetical protein
MKIITKNLNSFILFILLWGQDNMQKSIKKIVVLLIFIIIAITVNARDIKNINNNNIIPKINNIEDDSKPIEWVTTFGGSGRDVAFSLEKTNDEAFIIIGETSSFDKGGGSDLWLLKFDANGNEIWNNSYGGKRSDFGFDGQQTIDGGFILVGGTRTFGEGDQDVWLVRTDSSGYELWNKSYGGEDMEHGISVQETSDKGYIIVGGTKSKGEGPNDYWIIKTDKNGDIQWDKTYGTYGYDWGYDIQKTNDGAYVFTGGTDTSTESEHILDIGLVKIKEDGFIEWEKVYNKYKRGWCWDEGYGVEPTLDGGYAIAGIARATGWSESEGGDAWLIKTDSNGKKQWDTLIGGIKCDSFTTVKQTIDKGFIVSGWTYSYGEGDCDLWLAKFDSIGNELWDMTFGGEKYEWSMFHTVQQVSENSYIIIGETKSFGAGGTDVLVVKVNEPSIEIDIKRGNGLSFIVKNNGNENISNLEWNFNLDGYLIAGSSHSEGIIESLPADAQLTIYKIGFFLGIGPAYIRINIDGVCKTIYCYMIGPFLLM